MHWSAMTQVLDNSFEVEFDSQYEIVEPEKPLGEGTYGKVFKAIQKQTGDSVAMKKIKLDSRDEGVPISAIREIAIIKALDHPNIVKLLDVLCSPSRLELIYELVDTDLKKFMKCVNFRLSPKNIRNLQFQLCRGIDFCHTRRVLHRDIKPQNLLINRSSRLLKIADFGLARACILPLPQYTRDVATIWYRAPELLLGSSLYSIPVDLWAVWCVLGEMATGAPLFPGDSEIGTIFKVFQKLGTPTADQWPGVVNLPCFKPNFPKWQSRRWTNIRNISAQVGPHGIDLLENGMVYDPSKRITARRALTHPYFQEET